MSLNPYKYSLTTRLKDTDMLKMLGPLRHDDRVLDMGCGLGYFTEMLACNGAKIHGIDLSLESLQSAKDRIAAFFTASSASRLPFKDNTFTKILFTDVIEHLEDDEEAVREIYRICRDQAEVVVTTAATEGFLTGSRLNRLFHDVPGTPEYHVRDGYSAEDLRRLFAKHGIEMVDVRYTTVLLGEIFIELLKLLYSFVKKDFATQADALDTGNSWLFKVYRYLAFPPMLATAKIENRLFSRWLKGHIIIVKGVVRKPPPANAS